MQKGRHMAEQDSSADAKAKKWHDFLNKINREEEYPTSIIQQLIVRKMQEGEEQGDEEASTQALSRQFAQDDVINGLCLLHCLKNNQIDKDVFEEEHTKEATRNSKNIMKAASLVKEFQTGVKKEEDHDDPQLKLGRYLARGAPGTGTGPPGSATYGQRAGQAASFASPGAAGADAGASSL